ncbi:MAG TPA: hypothetical protein VM841_12225 [Actinomycetota bacterium]|nr:hypothetical protein [Actinomycetota bacterium]
MLKKIFGLMVAGLLVFGGSAAFADGAPACEGPVSTDCDNDGDGVEDCDLFVSIEGIELCENL